MRINLEKELIRQNKAVISVPELLLVKEYDRLGNDVTNDEVLNRVGVNSAAKKGKEIKTKQNQFKADTAKFPQERVFHISQIEKLCNKYYLKFLPSAMFKGAVDPALAGKITQAELAYGVVMTGSDAVIKGYTVEPVSEFDLWAQEYQPHRIFTMGLRRNEKYIKANTFIIAPASSFNLQEKPVDPLFMYQINDEYFFLVHKWGNDLSIFRGMLSILSSPRTILLRFAFFASIIGSMPFSYVEGSKEFAYFMMYLAFPTLATGISYIFWNPKGGGIIRQNNWKSIYKYD